jgi:hypothetical protein
MSDTTSELEAAALAAITLIIQHVESAKSGAVDPQVALAGINAVQAALQANNAKADSDLDAKFPKG